MNELPSHTFKIMGTIGNWLKHGTAEVPILLLINLEKDRNSQIFLAPSARTRVLES